MAQAPTTYGQPSSGYGYDGTGSLSASSPLMRLITVILCFAGLSLILISLRPFQAQSIVAEIPESGDKLKQVGFLAAGAIFSLALLTMADPRRLRSLITPGFVLLGILIVY